MNQTPRMHPHRAQGDTRYAMRYAGEELAKMDFRIRMEGSVQEAAVLVVDFTGRGFGVRLSNQAPIQPKAGDRVDLMLYLQGQRISLFPCVTAYRGQSANQDVALGFKRLFGRHSQTGLLESRQSPRIVLPAFLGLRASMQHPLLFGHVTRFRLIDVNLGMGYCLETDDSLFLGLEGDEVRLRFDLPGGKEWNAQARISWVQPMHSRQLRIGAQIWDLPYAAYQIMIRLFLYSDAITPGQLQEAGFFVRHIPQDFQIRQVTDPKGYAALLHLRQEVHSKREQGQAVEPAEHFAFASDADGRLLAAWHGGRAIGSVALERSATESAPCMEAKHFCVNRDFRGTDVLEALLRKVLKTFLYSDCCTLRIPKAEALESICRDFGFQEDREHWLLGKQAALQSQGLTWQAWLMNYGSVALDLWKRRRLELSPWRLLSLRLGLLARPWLRRRLDQSHHAAYRRHLSAWRQAQGL